MFSPLETIAGALLIQFGTSSYLLQSGKTIGFSSIIYNSIRKPSLINNWSIVCGIILSSLFGLKYLGDFIPSFDDNTGILKYAIAGLLVGFGTNLGCGCTSGHFLNGLARLRLRSFVASATFTVSGVLANFVFNKGESCHDSSGNVINCYNYDSKFSVFKNNQQILIQTIGVSFLFSYIILPTLSRYLNNISVNQFVRDSFLIVNNVFSSFLFGLGLIISGMSNPAKPLGFLSVLDRSKFDPSLLLIVVFAVIPNIFLFRKIIYSNPSKPLLNEKYYLANSNEVSPKFIIGNAIFGLGWGLLGICPGPGIISLIFNTTVGAVWIFSFLTGYCGASYCK